MLLNNSGNGSGILGPTCGSSIVRLAMNSTSRQAPTMKGVPSQFHSLVGGSEAAAIRSECSKVVLLQLFLKRNAVNTARIQSSRLAGRSQIFLTKDFSGGNPVKL